MLFNTSASFEEELIYIYFNYLNNFILNFTNYKLDKVLQVKIILNLNNNTTNNLNLIN